jgi:ribonuclease J
VIPTSKELLFLPLGGAGEIGMNLSLYGHDGYWLMVDCGVVFGDERVPGIDVMVPDISFISAQRDKLVGIVLTHAHEDHLGALPWLWPALECPVYATPFAAGLLRRKLPETGLEGRIPIREVPLGGGISLPPFEITCVPMAHSIPETQALAIKTRVGTVLHATDWKIDPEPLIGPVTDEAALRRIGDDGVAALMCDSTNIMVEGKSGSEGPLRKSLAEVIGDCPNRVAVACFASNVARMESVMEAAEATGRRVALVGRSLVRMAEIARECGYLTNCPEFVSPYDVGYLPREEVLLLVTGSQGESRAALTRIASGDHPEISLDAGDTVIYSSKEIPGNEKAISRVQNDLARIGVDIITERDEFVHVSGHPARDEVAQLYDWVKPSLLVPIHGELRHLTENCRFAASHGIPHTAMAENGEIMRLAPGPAEIVGRATAGRLAIDGKRLIPVEGEVIRMRRRMTYGGVVVATVAINKKGKLLGEAQVSAPGLVDGAGEDQDIREEAAAAITDAVASLSSSSRKDDEKVKNVSVRAARQVFRGATGRRPSVDIHVVRV